MSGTGLKQVLDALQAQVQSAVNALPAGGPVLPTNVIVKEGWISQQEMTALLGSSTPTALITIYDTKSEKDATRWINTLFAGSYSKPILGEAVSPSTPQPVPSGDSVKFTLSLASGFSAPQAGDAISLAISIGVFQATGVEYTIISTDTLATALSNLANLANSSLSSYGSATASGNTITWKNTNADYEIATFGIGGIGSMTVETGRTQKLFQIDYWAPTEAIREFVADQVDAALDYLRTQFGIQLADGNYARIMYSKTNLDDEHQERDVYRRISQFWVEYARTYSLPAYTVLVPELTTNISY